jgi:hypothetical protein
MMETAENRPAPNDARGANTMAASIRRRELLEHCRYPWPKAHVRPRIIEMGDPRFRDQVQVTFIHAQWHPET